MGEGRSNQEGTGEEDEDEDDEVECRAGRVVAGGGRRGGLRKAGSGGLGVRVRVMVLLVEATGFEEGMRGGRRHGGEGGERVDHVKSRIRERAADAAMLASAASFVFRAFFFFFFAFNGNNASLNYKIMTTSCEFFVIKIGSPTHILFLL